MKSDGELGWMQIGVIFLVFAGFIFFHSCTADATVTSKPLVEIEAPGEPLLTAYIFDTPIQAITVICVSYTADLRRWGKETAPGYCFTEHAAALLDAVERQHRKREDEVSPPAFGSELG